MRIFSLASAGTDFLSLVLLVVPVKPSAVSTSGTAVLILG